MSVICDKEAFEKYTDGIEKLKHMNRRKGRHKYSLYKCSMGGMYHVTTITKKALTPKKMNKYRIDPSEKGKSIKIENVPGMAPIPRQSKPAKDSFQKPATRKLITTQQATILKLLMNKGIYHVRVELDLKGDHHPMFFFYNVKAPDKTQAGWIARKQAVVDYGGELNQWAVGHVWEEGVLVDLEKYPVINDQKEN